MFSFFNNKDFFKMLSEQAEKTEEGIAFLVDFMNAPTAENGKKINLAEDEADEIRRKLIDDLNRTFVTPIDREDIYSLSRVVDDVIDYAKSTVEEILLFEAEPDSFIKQMAGVLHEATKDIVYAIKSINKHPGSCTEHIIRAKKAENKIERLYRGGLVELFKTENVIKILKTREIYRHLSNAADRIVTAADIIADILVKNS